MDLARPAPLVLVAVMACKSAGGGADAGERPIVDGGASRGAVVTALASCVRGGVVEFLARATELESAAAALASAPDEARKEAARAAFRAALDAWQVLEPAQVGPAAPSTQPGGQDLRDQIYSWPLVSPCAVDGEIVARGWESPGFAASLVNRRGLAALEYLLFGEAAESQCPAGSPPLAGWAALAADERAARRRAYAAAAAADLRRRATALADAWDPAKGNFIGLLQSAGPGNRSFATHQHALNAFSNALLYVDLQLKDLKLSRPLGLRDCAAATCPELIESRFAARSKVNVAANLAGFRRLTEGCEPGFEGAAFDDLLEGVGATKVAAALRERNAGAVRALEAIEEPDLEKALAADPASVRALHAAIKAITDILKTEFMTVLDLEIADDIPGDND